MNVRVPWLIVLVSGVAVVGGAYAGGYWTATRVKSETIENLRVEVNTVKARSDSTALVLRDTASALLTLANSIAAKVDTIRATDTLLVANRNEAGADLTEYLEDDELGLRLLASYNAAWQSVVNNREHLIQIREDENVVLRRIIAVDERLIAGLEFDVDSLTVLAHRALDEADAAYRAAHPPFHVKLIRDGWKFAAGVLIGYGAAKL